MPNILGFKELSSALNRLSRKSKNRDDGSVIVGYTANYALHVHETLEPAEDATRKARNAAGGQQGKFLEQPARTETRKMKEIVEEAAPRVGIVQALLVAGLFLQRASQLLVPVDTGNLKGSAFTRKE